MATAATSATAIPTVIKKRKIEDDDLPQEETKKEEKSIMKAPRMEIDEAAFSPELLREYYSRLFPYGPMFKWLGYNSPEAVSNREWSMTLAGDIYLRFRSFDTKEDFRAELLRQNPIKIDIGAGYNVPPSQKASVAKFTPLWKELVFDIDITDYDSVRTCCKEASICHQCWPLMNAAIKVVDRGLRDDFGFQHIMWVYSGRRGVHCWISDLRARSLGHDGREAIAEYFSVEHKTDKKRDTRLPWPLHPSQERAKDLLLPYFRQMLHSGDPDKQPFGTDASCRELLQYIDEKDRDNLYPFKEKAPWARFEELETRVQQYIDKHKKMKVKLSSQVQTLIAHIVFHYTYPRLDVNVTKQLHHLLKSPFCVHPKTGMVCVPIIGGAEACDDFKPWDTPTLATLHKELNAALASSDKESAWQQTSLRPYLEWFDNSFCTPLSKATNAERSAARKRLAAAKAKEAAAAAKEEASSSTAAMATGASIIGSF